MVVHGTHSALIDIEQKMIAAVIVVTLRSVAQLENAAFTYLAAATWAAASTFYRLS